MAEFWNIQGLWNSCKVGARVLAAVFSPQVWQ